MTAEPVAPYVPPVASRQSFDDFYAEHYGRVLRLVARTFGPADGEDIAQETMVRAFERYDRLHQEDDLWPWVAVVARNIGRDLQRSRARLVSVDDVDPHALPPAPGPTPAEALVERDDARLLALALRKLAPQDVNVLRLREFEGLGYDAIARRMGVSPNTVRQQLHRAKLHLAREFRKAGGRPALLLPLLPAFAKRFFSSWRESAPAGVAFNVASLPALLAIAGGLMIAAHLAPAPRPAYAMPPAASGPTTAWLATTGAAWNAAADRTGSQLAGPVADDVTDRGSTRPSLVGTVPETTLDDGPPAAKLDRRAPRYVDIADEINKPRPVDQVASPSGHSGNDARPLPVLFGGITA